jgi:hypothetical protein
MSNFRGCLSTHLVLLNATTSTPRLVHNSPPLERYCEPTHNTHATPHDFVQGTERNNLTCDTQATQRSGAVEEAVACKDET